LTALFGRGTPVLPRAAWRDAQVRPSRDPYGDALRSGRGPLALRDQTGRRLPLDVERWCAEPDQADVSTLDRCSGPTLDIGCGPGRLTIALARRGVPALGVDVHPAAVARTVAAGASALCRSVFDPLPAEGRWRTVLLIDGNVGIGGDPVALLRRAVELLHRDGTLLVETDPQQVTEVFTARLEGAGGALGQPFRWARVNARTLARLAAAAGCAVADRWTSGERSFTCLVPAARPDGSAN
jgi:SAM-dependent methyltransferase